jgi:hypothetical protein
MMIGAMTTGMTITTTAVIIATIVGSNVDCTHQLSLYEVRSVIR